MRRRPAKECVGCSCTPSFSSAHSDEDLATAGAALQEDAERAEKVQTAVAFLQKQLHKSVSSVLGGDDMKVAWTATHEQGFQQCVRYVLARAAGVAVAPAYTHPLVAFTQGYEGYECKGPGEQCQGAHGGVSAHENGACHASTQRQQPRALS